MRGVLVYVYTSLLRLLHPFMPFVTEELWGALPHGPGPLIVAAWPKVSAHVDQAALDDYASLQVCRRLHCMAGAEIEACRGGSSYLPAAVARLSTFSDLRL